jgi:hypothetical protein
MHRTGSQISFEARMTDGAWGGEHGSMTLAGENRRLDMVGTRLLTKISPESGNGPMVNLVMAGPLGGMTDAVILTPDQASELGAKLLALASKARSLREGKE